MGNMLDMKATEVHTITTLLDNWLLLSCTYWTLSDAFKPYPTTLERLVGLLQECQIAYPLPVLVSTWLSDEE